jgi:hypothetical protein
MSDLRNKLQEAREAYRSQRYPGDLAAELLSSSPRRRTLPIRGILATVGFLTAAAAAVAIWVAIFPIAHHGPDEVAVVEPGIEFIAMPEFPSDVSLIVPAESVTELGAMPAMPAVDLTFSMEAESSEELS